MVKSIIILFLTCAAAATHAQKKIRQGNQQWIQYYSHVKLSEKCTLLADGGYRTADDFEKSVQYIARAALGYSLSSNIQLSLGFANLGFYSLGKINKTEFRPYEELLIKNVFKKFELTHRYRVEERFFNFVVGGKIQRPGTFNFRFRYSMMAEIPLFKLSKSDIDKKILLSIGDEIFLNAGKQIVYNVFDQDRFIVSPTLQFNKNFSISLTWNNQFASTKTQTTYNYTNVLWLQLKQKLNLIHKRE